MALADWQISFAGLTMGAYPVTPYRVLALNGVRGPAPVQSNDTPLLTADGVFSGYDTQLGRTIDATVIVGGTSASDLETNIAALETAMAPLLSTTSSLHWKLPSKAEDSINARPRKCDIPILPTYKKLFVRAELMWFCPAPAVA